jgi:hypothetical protein
MGLWTRLRGGGVIDLKNLFTISLDDYGLVVQGYFGDYYTPWRTLILATLVIAGLKIWRRWRDK